MTRRKPPRIMRLFLMETDGTFQGFSVPEQNWSKLPHQFFEVIPNMTHAELVCVLYVLRHTWGYAEYDEPKKITIDEFMKGRKYRDGSRIDAGTGLSKQSVINGLKGAVTKGYLLEYVDDSDKGRIKKSYVLNIQGSKILTSGSKILTSRVKKLDTVQRKKPKKEKDISADPPLTTKELADVNRKVDTILGFEKMAQNVNTYPNRSKFPEGVIREFADAYVRLTGQEPVGKNVTFWVMVFEEWRKHGYSVKVLEIARAIAKRDNLVMANPASYTNTMNYVHGELKTGNTFSDLIDVEKTEDKWWKKVGGDV